MFGPVSSQAGGENVDSEFGRVVFGVICFPLERPKLHAFRNPSDMAMSALHLNRTAGDRLDRVIIQKIMHDT
jgi:hypothetical protein